MDIKHVLSRKTPLDTSYEDAVKALHNLQSNAETIAKARQNVNRKVINNISNMIRYILRSGLTMEDVDRLSVIHISGTKGKGSTCALCERVLYFHGYKTGLFTSPHMIEVRERIRINGRPISQRMFSKYFWKVYNSLQMTQTENAVGADDGGGMPPYFAFLTVLSLHVFLSEGVDVAVVEVGIGGQYDSTNFFSKPVVCGVTSLGLDHTALLGNTITEIAWNKAGIFKPGRPAITVPHEQAALEVLLERAHDIQSPLYVAKEISEELIHRQNIKLGIAGAKQIENASLAIQLFHFWEQAHINDRDMTEDIPSTLSSVKDLPQLEVSELDKATLKGLATCVWPGRAQTIYRGDVTYYLDGAHTKESMEVCAQWFTQAVKQEEQGGKRCARILLFNTTSDRDVGSLLASLTGCKFDAVIFCTNLLSVVESLNRADQLNRTVTPKWMMEKVDGNKAVWDDLIAKKRQKSTVGADGDKQCQIDHGVTAHVDCSSDSTIVLDHNLNRAHQDMSKEVVQMEIGPDYEGNSSKKRKVPYAAHADSQTVSVCQSCSHVRQICSSTHNNSTADGKNALTETDNSVIAQDGFSGEGEQYSKPSSNNILQSHVNHVEFNPETSFPKNIPLSVKFSCIIHALEWATQGRDQPVTGCDPEFCVPSIPSCLSDADQLQILVTGSLHLVGGVLGVVDPQMND